MKIEVVVKVGGQLEVAMCENGSGGQNGEKLEVAMCENRSGGQSG